MPGYFLRGACWFSLIAQRNAVGTRFSEARSWRLSLFGARSLTGEGPHLLLYEERLRDWSLYAYEYRFSLGEGDRAQVACS